MLAPLCCWSCNKRVGALWVPFCGLVGDGAKPPGEALDELGVRRQCCRRMLLTVVELNTLFNDHETAHAELRHIEVERTCEFERCVSCDGTAEEEEGAA